MCASLGLGKDLFNKTDERAVLVPCFTGNLNFFSVRFHLFVRIVLL